MIGEGFSKDICRSLVAMLDKDHSGLLGYEEFKKLLIELAMWKVRNWRIPGKS
jgi:calpain